jgi:hypothetical protein
MKDEEADYATTIDDSFHFTDPDALGQFQAAIDAIPTATEDDSER